MKHDINKKIFLDFSLKFVGKIFNKLKIGKQRQAMSVLKSNFRGSSFRDDSKKIFYKLAFASLIISFLKIKKNFIIDSFCKIRDYEYATDRAELYPGNFGLPKGTRMKIKRDVQDEFNNKKNKTGMKGKKKRRVGRSKGSGKRGKKYNSGMITMRRHCRNKSYMRIKGLPRKESLTSVSSFTSKKKSKHPTSRLLWNKVNNINLMKDRRNTTLNLYSAETERKIDFSFNKKTFYNRSMHKMKCIDSAITRKKSTKESVRSRSFFERVKIANFEDKSLKFETIGSKLVSELTKRSKVSTLDKDSYVSFEKNRPSFGSFIGSVISSRHDRLESRLKGIRRRFNLA